MCSKEDFHFIRLTDSGLWYSKTGAMEQYGGVMLANNEVNRNKWRTLVSVNGEYRYPPPQLGQLYSSSSGPLYFAIRIGWDEES